jgi:RNA ligase
MNYKFPVIHTIDDVLPHIEGREEFIVAEREFGTVINYMVAMADTFDMNGTDDLGGAIRRECRGIKFYPDGRIAARPFHKFFNVGERAETLVHSVDFSCDHRILTKLDGSMIHPILVGGYVRLCTKMGITEVAMNAEEYTSKNSRYNAFMKWAMDNDLTPLFEWCSRKNRIVIDYPEDSLTLLAVRHNITGEYLDVIG